MYRRMRHTHFKKEKKKRNTISYTVIMDKNFVNKDINITYNNQRYISGNSVRYMGNVIFYRISRILENQVSTIFVKN